MYEQIIDLIKPELEKVIDFVQKRLSSIRAGRASPALVENIQVECFGQKLPLNQLAAISVLNPQQLLIQSWDKSYLESIEKAIGREHPDLSFAADKDGIKINLPPLSEEFRGDLLKVLSQTENDAKKTIRCFRDEAWSKIQKETRSSNIREDDKFKAKDELQDLIDNFNEKIDKLIENKKREIES